jgi:hypothetical protein
MLLSIILLFTQAAFANGPEIFKGEWEGTGIYQREGQQSYCREFTMKFDGNRYLMNFLGGNRECERHSERFASVAMAHSAGKLFYNGKEVGSIKDNVLETKFSMPEGNGRVRHWRMSMRIEGDTLVYEESRTMDSESTPLISFSGLLMKKK